MLYPYYTVISLFAMNWKNKCMLFMNVPPIDGIKMVVSVFLGKPWDSLVWIANEDVLPSRLSQPWILITKALRTVFHLAIEPAGVKSYFGFWVICFVKYVRTRVFLICIFAYKDKIIEFIISRRNNGQRKFVFWHILDSADRDPG